MNQSTNGEIKCSTEVKNLNKKLNDLYESMEAFQKEVGSPNPRNNIEDIEECFEWSRSEVESLTCERCAETTLLLQLHSYYLRKKLNRLKAAIGFLESEINIGIGKASREYDTAFRERGEKRAMMIADNVYLSKANDYLIQFTSRLHAIESDCYHIDNICGALKNVQYTKRPQNAGQSQF